MHIQGLVLSAFSIGYFSSQVESISDSTIKLHNKLANY